LKLSFVLTGTLLAIIGVVLSVVVALSVEEGYIQMLGLILLLGGAAVIVYRATDSFKEIARVQRFLASQLICTVLFLALRFSRSERSLSHGAMLEGDTLNLGSAASVFVLALQ
jgi:hypothetical protein